MTTFKEQTTPWWTVYCTVQQGVAFLQSYIGYTNKYQWRAFGPRTCRLAIVMERCNREGVFVLNVRPYYCYSSNRYYLVRAFHAKQDVVIHGNNHTLLDVVLCGNNVQTHLIDFTGEVDFLTMELQLVTLHKCHGPVTK